MLSQFTRSELVFGKENVAKLGRRRVAVFGLGGVGSYVVEVLARAGIGKIDLIDNDEYSLTNINRQLYATHSTLGRSKVDVAAERIRDINPDCEVTKHKLFYLSETESEFDFGEYDYVVDAIDTISGKLSLIKACDDAGTPIICSMGMGNKVNPTMIEVADISKTSVCPLAKVIRKKCKEMGIKKLKVVYSKEVPVPRDEEVLKEIIDAEGKGINGSTSFVPPVAGFVLASEVIKDLINCSD